MECGHIKVDEFQNTTASGVYAVGDVAGKALLTPGDISVLMDGPIPRSLMGVPSVYQSLCLLSASSVCVSHAFVETQKAKNWQKKFPA